MKEKNEEFIPSYVKIQNFILENIQQGIYSPGDKIPSENEIAQMFSVSRITANMAIKEWSIMGVVTRQKGKGSFVSDSSDYSTSSKMLAPNLFLKPLVPKKHCLERTMVIEAYPELLEKFHLKEHALVYEIIRSVQHRGQLMALDFSYLPIDLTGYLPIQSDEITKTCLHDYLQKHSECNPKYLSMYINTPLYSFMHYDKLSFTDQENLICWTTDILNKEKKTIATTFTISPENKGETPFMTFSIG